MATDTPAAEIDYPTTDGRPMAESDLHRQLMVSLIERLALHFAPRPDVYVSGNLMVFYEEGAPRRFLAPDAFVVFGVPPGRRESYKAWREGKLPDVVFEVTSRTTAKEDTKKKYRRYEEVWRVAEYFLFDPLAEYLDPPLLGYRRERGFFREIAPVDGVLASTTLGLTLSRQGSHLVLRDAATGAELLTPAEAAEAEVARLKAELDALRGGSKPRSGGSP
jgi:Uma2 family endonuclease